MLLSIPELSLVVLIGPSGSGKSSFARKHFKRTEILSSDYCRGLVSDDQNDQTATNDAFDVLRFIARHTGFLPRTRRIAPNRNPNENRLAGLVPNRGSIGLQGGVLAEDRIRTPITTSPTRRFVKFRFPMVERSISIDIIRIGAVFVRSLGWADLLCPKIGRAPRSREVIVFQGPPVSFARAAQDNRF